MNIHGIHDCSDQTVINILKTGLSAITDSNYIKNYHPDYSNEPGNLFYILNNDRYIRGTYYVVEQDGQYVCSSGWNEYQLCPDIALVLTRSYIMPEYRGKYIMGNYLLPKMIEEAKVAHKKIWITANSHNKAIYSWFKRAHDGKKTALCNDWPDIYRNFVPIGMKDIYYTQQYVAEYRE